MAKVFAFLSLVALFFSSTSLASSSSESIAKVEQYLNNLTTLEATFLQRSSTGNQASGRFYLDRSNERFKLDYDDPTPIMILARRGKLTYFDKELQQPSFIDLDETPAAVLLQSPLNVLSIDATPGVLETEEILELAFQPEGREEEITLTFQKKPFQLTRWSVLDVQGVVTDIYLQNIQVGQALPGALFRFRNPEFFTTLE